VLKQKGLLHVFTEFAQQPKLMKQVKTVGSLADLRLHCHSCKNFCARRKILREIAKHHCVGEEKTLKLPLF